MDKLDVLRKCDVFRTLSDEQLHVLEKMCTVHDFQPGDILSRQDKVVNKLYVVEKGLIGIILEVGPLAQRQVQAATDLDVVGWSAMIEPHIATATAKVLETTRALEFDGRELHDLCLTRPEIGCRISRGVARVVATRLRNAFTQLLGVGSSLD